MPATRSARPNSKDKEPAAHSRSRVPEDEVIVISSDDEASDSTTLALRKAKEEIRLLKKQLVAKQTSSNQSSSQVLSEQKNQQMNEGHSSAHVDESEGEQHRLKAHLQQVTKDITKLQSALRFEKEIRTRESLKVKKLKKRAKLAEMEIANLKTLNENLINDSSVRGEKKRMPELEDHILCEICSDTLWHPYMLTECGHTLCQGCLTDWFNTAIVANAHHPLYSCPKCRTRVYRKPIEDFVLKGVVRAVAHAIDPAGGSPPAHPRHYVGYGPWHRFFGQ